MAARLFDRGERSLQRFLDAIEFELLPQEQEKAFLNWNRPGDL